MIHNDLINHLSFFPTIGIKITALCGMKCGFCCEPNKNQPIYSLDNYLKILEIIAAAGAKRICITGGEPLLYPAINELLIFARQRGLVNVLSTADGKRFLSNELSISTLDIIRFSVHGLGNIHDDIVGMEKAFDEIEEAVIMAVSKGYHVAVTTVVTRSNIDYIVDIAEWCLRLGVERYYLFGFLKSGNGESYAKKHGVTNDNFDILVNKIKTQFSTSKLEVRIHSYRNNAECIIVYGNGDVYIDPYHGKPPYKKIIGNFFLDDARQIFAKVINDPELSEDYIRHIRNSSVFR